MIDTLGLTAERCVELLDARELSCRELTEAYLDRIERLDGAVHAFLRVRSAEALAEADRLDAEGRTGLQGVPIALKDILCTRGEETTAGSRILQGHRPLYDAGCVTRAKAAGLVPIGKTNMDEFAMGSSTEHSAFGVTHNPWDPSRVPGGSSGGSAAAVAAGFAPLSLGTDTGGSIRQPAALCGIVGLKPTYGAVSRHGLIAFGSSLDQVGPFALTVRDAALAYQAIAGHDPCDSTSVPLPQPVRIPDAERLDGRSHRRALPPAGAGDRAGRARVIRCGPGACGVAGRGDPARRATACAVRAAGVLPDRAGRGVRQPGALRRRPLRPASRGARRHDRRDVRADAGGGLRRRGQAADHARHLCAVVRLLRRLLRDGAAHPDADPAGLRRGVREGRPDLDADLADGRVPDRRPPGRPVGDVRVRCADGAAQPERAARASRSPAGCPRGCRWASS